VDGARAIISAGNLAASRHLNNRLQILIRDHLDDVPALIEDLNVASAIASALLCIPKR
jgi:hypothetical protein